LQRKGKELVEAHPPAGTASTWPNMRYGDLEHVLIELTGGDKRSVLGRFRNLRQLPFPDAIKTGTGNHVEYDLPRVLAFCAVYSVNALLVPQAHSVALVRETWPELVRGFIAGAVEMGIADLPREMPKDISAVVSILPDGFAQQGQAANTAANLPLMTRGGAVADLRIDCAALMAIIAPWLSRAATEDGASSAFRDLDRSFGWSTGFVPHRASVADMFAGSSFLDRGPYLERAAAFLSIAATLPTQDDQPPGRRRSVEAAQNLLDYLGRPVPIDEWKGEIGSEDGQPRLKHFIAAVGAAVRLTPPNRWPETILATTGGAPAKEASALIEKAAAIERAKRAGHVATSPT
jgi:hypothetical protein